MTAPPEPVLAPLEYAAPLANPAGGGLYAAANGPLPAPGHWFAGLYIKPINCGTAFGTWEVDPCFAPVDADATKGGERAANHDPFYPLVTWGYDECDPQETEDALLARARQNQRLHEQTTVEDVFGQRIMTDATSIGAAADLVEAVSLLEARIATEHNIVSVLHAGAQWAAYAARYSLSSGAAVPRSPLGHAWAFGGGYVDALDNTIVATGPVTVWADSLAERASVDAMRNTRVAVVERGVAVGYECFAYSVTVGA